MIRRDATDRPNLGWRKPWASLVVASYPDRARTVAWANCARIMQGRADKEGPTLTQEVPMEGQPGFVGIDVSKAQVDVAVRPTGQRWVVSYDETGVKELVSQMVGLGPAMVLLEATGGLELPLVAALAAAALPLVVVNGGGQPASGQRLRQGHRNAGQDRRSGRGGPGPFRRRRPSLGAPPQGRGDPGPQLADCPQAPGIDHAY